MLSTRLLALHGVRYGKDIEMALTGLKPPAPLNLDDNLSMNWRAWYDSYQIYATAAGVSNKPEKVQCCVFLHVAGAEAQKVHRTFELPSDDQDKIKPLTDAFQEYCEGKTNVTVIRYQFNSYNQASEPMDTYIRELQSCIAHCQYGPVENSMLCDRLVCGVRDSNLRDRLLQTPNLDITQCMEMCRLNENRASQLSEREHRNEGQVNAVAQANTTQQRAAPPRGATWAKRPNTSNWSATRF